jgi:hypothetical protein
LPSWKISLFTSIPIFIPQKAKKPENPMPIPAGNRLRIFPKELGKYTEPPF